MTMFEELPTNRGKTVFKTEKPFRATHIMEANCAGALISVKMQGGWGLHKAEVSAIKLKFLKPSSNGRCIYDRGKR